MGRAWLRANAIWFFAFGYFAAYAPYSALTKVLSSGLSPSFGPQVKGFALLPLSVGASVIGMFAMLSALKWWGAARRRTIAGVSMPFPGLWTSLSALCTAAIIVTTTLAYTIHGASIVFMMLLMRGGVLAIAPVVDVVSRRHVRWFSWVALGLSLAALLTAVGPGTSTHLPPLGVIDVSVYLLAYFIRLRFMSRLAKGSDEDNRRFFVEEQMVASPAAMLLLGAIALFGPGEIGAATRAGFTDVAFGPAALAVVVVGVLSQMTGVFGGLILLDKSENTFAVPVNRASSVIAGVVASYSLAWIYGTKTPGQRELLGAGLIALAIVVLTVGPKLRRGLPTTAAPQTAGTRT